MVSKNGHYIEVYMSTPLDVCEKRDVKGLYKKAREGLVQNFTGISDPYEIPKNPDIIIDSTNMTPNEAAEIVINELKKRNLN